MNYTAPFVLRQDVLLIPCTDLDDDLRRRIAFEEGDFTLSRRHGRALAQVIDRETAALLQLFREPRTIVDAVIENSRSLGKDPEVGFDELLPHLGTFMRNRVLVPAGAEDEKEIRPRLESGTAIAGRRIVRCLSLAEDSEIYQLRDAGGVAAMKIAREATPHLRMLLDNEAAILRHLDGSGIAPRLLDQGTHEGRPYLILEWISGVEPGVAAAHRHHDRPALIELCVSVAAAYAALHERGVLHADVHPHNIIAGDNARIIDFGYSRFAGQPPRTRRAGVMHFYEPEYLAARREGGSLAASQAGEQYAVAAVLYLLVAGQPYLDFHYELEEMTRQIENDPPLPFAARGVPPWPDVEGILFRALEKDPSRRHRSMAEMAALLESVREEMARTSFATPLAATTHAFLEHTLQAMSPDGEAYAARYPTPPRASLNYGCAGAAVGLLRIAEARGDPALLALAAVWHSRAVALLATEEAFYNHDLDLRPETVGRVTPYHSESGVHAAGAMIAAARGDTHALQAAIAAFIDASRRPCREIDLTVGRLGSLLGATLLLGISDDVPASGESLRAFGRETLGSVWMELDSRPPIGETAEAYLGMAHGWTGYLYATMRWCAASGDPLPPRLVQRLEELAELKTMHGRGAYWRVRAGNDASRHTSGWCHGTAGQLFTFLLAHRLLGDDRWLQLAGLAAWNDWDEPRGVASLCCGTAGRAYALLDYYRHTGDPAWLARARELANHAASVATATSHGTNALWKGELGVAVLIADLGAPEQARMPFFE